MKKNYKFILLFFLSLVAFYFLLFRNIFNLMEIKEHIEQEEIKIQKLEYEKQTSLKALTEKRKELNEKNKKLEKKDEDIKEKFSNLPFLLEYLGEKIKKNSLSFENFSRSQKDEGSVKIGINLKGREEDVKNFFYEIENDIYDINFSDSYFKINQDANLLEAKVGITASILDEFEEQDLQLEDKNVFTIYSNDKNSRTSIMRIGVKKFYRAKKSKEAKNEKNL